MVVKSKRRAIRCLAHGDPAQLQDVVQTLRMMRALVENETACQADATKIIEPCARRVAVPRATRNARAAFMIQFAVTP